MRHACCEAEGVTAAMLDQDGDNLSLEVSDGVSHHSRRQDPPNLGHSCRRSVVADGPPCRPKRPDPAATTPSAPVPRMGWGGGAMGQRSADARFIVMMIPHHQGAIAMAELALQRSKRPEIRALAERIRTSQSQ